MRIPLASPLKTRTNDLSKDARVKNGLVEMKGEMSAVRNRPGATDIYTLDGSWIAGTDIAQLLFEDDNGDLLTMFGDGFRVYQWNNFLYVLGYGPEYGYGSYSSEESYDIGDSVVQNGVKYYSYVDNNIGNTPGSSYVWSETPPTSNRYVGTLYGTYPRTGDVCASKEVAAQNVTLKYPYHSCATQNGSHQWIEYSHIASGGYGANTIFFDLFADPSSGSCTGSSYQTTFGLGSVAQTA